MYLWRRLAAPHWLKANEETLRSRAGDNLAIIEQSNRKRLQLEVACRSRREAHELVKEFAGQIQKLPRDWVRRCVRRPKTKSIKIGNRELIIPEGVAFGTGEHATTAMTLRLLERTMRLWGAYAPSRAASRGSLNDSLFSERFSARRRKRHARRVHSPDLIVDLGTGSGILALAARYFGAKSVVAIDIDPMAISTARGNARLNKINKVDFQLADVRHWKFPRKIDIVTANLFSKLLIEILPKLKQSRWLILSGILREQERELVRAVQRDKIDIIDVRRRGKWIAIVAKGTG